MKKWEFSKKKISKNENNPFFGFFLPQTIISLFSDYLLNRKWIVKIYSNKANIQSDAIVTQFTRHFLFFLIQFKPNLNDKLKWFQSYKKEWSTWHFELDILTVRA